MYTPKDNQGTFWDVENWLPSKKLEQIEKSWADAFRKNVLPILIEVEPSFARLYHPSMGAPNKSVAVLIGLTMLQNTFDLSDAEVVESFEFNMLWHYAFDVSVDDAQICVKTLYNFRLNLMENNAACEVFKRVTDAISKKWNLKTTNQRLDSTQVMSNMAQLTRLGLFIRTIQMFLNALKKAHPEAFAELPKRFGETYLDRKGYFASVKKSQAKRKLQESGGAFN